MKIKEPLIIWGLISGITCNWLMLTFAIEQAITKQPVILDFNIFKELWVEIPLFTLGFIGLFILILNKINEM